MFVDVDRASSHKVGMLTSARRTRSGPPDHTHRPTEPTPPSTRECAVEVTVSLIGGKWKPILLFHLLDGLKRYSELQRLVPAASDRMLTRSLRELEADGLVSRTIHAEVPPRVEYALTDEGCSLVPILQAMSRWGSQRRTVR